MIVARLAAVPALGGTIRPPLGSRANASMASSNSTAFPTLTLASWIPSDDAEAGDNFDVAALDPSERRKSLPERREAGPCLRVVADPDEKADPSHPLGLLRPRRERPSYGHAPEQRDERAPSDESCHVIPPAGRATEG